MIENLVQRQAEILADLDRLNGEELALFANSTLPLATGATDADHARRLLLGLVRRRDVGRNGKGGHYAAMVRNWPSNTPAVILALPGFFVISLMTLPDGSFDRKHILKEPVIAWRVEAGDYVVPLRPGAAVTDRWAVLTPEGFVLSDEYSDMFDNAPRTLNDWIECEIDLLEGGHLEREDLQVEHPTGFAQGKH